MRREIKLSENGEDFRKRKVSATGKAEPLPGNMRAGEAHDDRAEILALNQTRALERQFREGQGKRSAGASGGGSRKSSQRRTNNPACRICHLTDGCECKRAKRGPGRPKIDEAERKDLVVSLRTPNWAATLNIEATGSNGRIENWTINLNEQRKSTRKKNATA